MLGRPQAASSAADVTGFMMGGRRLALVHMGNAVRAYPISLDPFGIGREKANLIPIEDNLASKFHSRIIPKEGRVQAQDNDSRNGTRINEHMVSLQWLNPGDIIRIGRTVFIYLIEGMPLKRRPEDVTGVLKPSEHSASPLPVSALPLLLGKAPEADAKVTGSDAHFFMQVVAIPGGAQVTHLTHDPPRVTLLIEGMELSVGKSKYSYHAVGVEGKHGKEGQILRALEVEAARLDTETKVMGGMDPAAAFAVSPHKVGGCHISGTKGALLGRTFAVTDRPLLIGSDPGCDVVISSKAVSLRHARLRRKEGEPVVEDISNTIGVYVNGKRVRHQPLKPGDVISIATEEFMVHL